MPTLPNDRIEPTARTTVRRGAPRGVYDRAVIHRILDEALTCHVGFVDEGHAVVLPTIHVRVDDTLYLHGSRGSRMLRRLAEGETACITVTLVDGLVLARSAMHYSMNYRSVVVFTKGRVVRDRAVKLDALRALTEHVVPGRWAHVRPPSEEELAATTVMAFALDEASAKVRTGPPVDVEEDYALDVWAGVVPLSVTAGDPIADPKLRGDIPMPDHVRSYRR